MPRKAAEDGGYCASMSAPAAFVAHLQRAAQLWRPWSLSVRLLQAHQSQADQSLKLHQPAAVVALTRSALHSSWQSSGPQPGGQSQ
jgi:hypothetical protein